jgi:hypothetical protein
MRQKFRCDQKPWMSLKWNPVKEGRPPLARSSRESKWANPRSSGDKHVGHTIRFMTDEYYDQAIKDHAQYMEERKGLIDAARESARTFDQAVLAFGSAVFGASIAFLKDVAPKAPTLYVEMAGISWGLFSIGLLGALLSSYSAIKPACLRSKYGRTRWKIRISTDLKPFVASHRLV